MRARLLTAALTDAMQSVVSAAARDPHFNQLLVAVVWKAIVHWTGHAELPVAADAMLTSALSPAALRKSKPAEAHIVHAPEVTQNGVVRLRVNDWLESFAVPVNAPPSDTRVAVTVPSPRATLRVCGGRFPIMSAAALHTPLSGFGVPGLEVPLTLHKPLTVKLSPPSPPPPPQARAPSISVDSKKQA
jgi:hypothetical protein